MAVSEGPLTGVAAPAAVEVEGDGAVSGWGGEHAAELGARRIAAVGPRRVLAAVGNGGGFQQVHRVLPSEDPGSYAR